MQYHLLQNEMICLLSLWNYSSHNPANVFTSWIFCEQFRPLYNQRVRKRIQQLCREGKSFHSTYTLHIDNLCVCNAKHLKQHSWYVTFQQDTKKRVQPAIYLNDLPLTQNVSDTNYLYHCYQWWDQQCLNWYISTLYAFRIHLHRELSLKVSDWNAESDVQTLNSAVVGIG